MQHKYKCIEEPVFDHFDLEYQDCSLISFAHYIYHIRLRVMCCIELSNFMALFVI